MERFGSLGGQDGVWCDSTWSFIRDPVGWVRGRMKELDAVDGFRARLLGSRTVVLCGYRAVCEALVDGDGVGLSAAGGYRDLIGVGLLGPRSIVHLDDGSTRWRVVRERVETTLGSRLLGDSHYVKLVGSAVEAWVQTLSSASPVNLYASVRELVTVILIRGFLGELSEREQAQVRELMRLHFRAAAAIPVAFSVFGSARSTYSKGVWAMEQLKEKFFRPAMKRERERSVQDSDWGCGCILSLLMHDIEGQATLEDDEVLDLLLICMHGVIPKAVGSLVAFSASSLATDPDLLLAVRQELRTVNGPDLGLPHASMPLTHAVIRETSRMWPPLFGCPRGIFTPTHGGPLSSTTWGQPRALLVFAMANRDPEVFPNPHQFHPRRWLDGTTSVSPTTFGLGPRRCPGEPLTQNLCLSILTSLSHTFSTWTIPNSPHPTIPINDTATKYLPVASFQDPLYFTFQ